MNGAEVLVDSLLVNGIDVCFANPGTSEMHFVAALDRKPKMRCILGLSEGVVTGAADGYARMAGNPAATLLHLGPGLANGLANIHNARRAHTPMINVVGDHATYHLASDPPLASDIGSLARPMSNWVGYVRTATGVARNAAEAICHAMSPPGISTLVLPADCAWNEIPAVHVEPAVIPPLPTIADSQIGLAADLLKGETRVGILLNGNALRGEALEQAGAIAAATGARLLAETSSSRIERGTGRAPVDKVPYPIDIAIDFLSKFDALILIGSREPVAFFAYPGKPEKLVGNVCRVVTVASPDYDLGDAMKRLAQAVGAYKSEVTRPERGAELPGLPKNDDPLTSDAIAALVAHLLPANVIICDEALTSATSFFRYSAASEQHDYLAITGGAIGIGIPLATGAAVAAPGRKVIGLQADGSGMYTVQGLWTQAREKLDVITIVFANRAYRILEGELRGVGVTNAGPNARRMLELNDPYLNWVSIAEGMGVEATSVNTVSAFRSAFECALRRSGPFLIEAVI